MSIEKRIARLLTKNQKTLSLAESCSGGLVSHRLTNIPGSSKFFRLGVIAYRNQAKVKILHVPSSLLKKYGAVSEAVACGMAEGVRRLGQSDFGIGISGIAGPGGGSRQKPVGLVFIAVAAKTKTVSEKFLFKGNRLSVKKQAATQALKILNRFLKP